MLEKYDFLKSESIYSFDNSIDLKKFESFPIKTLPKTKNRTTLFYFGIIGQRRGVFTLLSVFQKAIKRGLKIDLLFVGPIDKADKRLSKNGLLSHLLKNSSITFLGLIYRNSPPILTALIFAYAL